MPTDFVQDVEASSGLRRTNSQGEDGYELGPEESRRPSIASVQTTQSARPLTTSSLDSTAIKVSNRDAQLFQFALELRNEAPDPAEPWFLEMTTLRRFNFIHINNQLAMCKKKFFEDRTASEKDLDELRTLLHHQGTLVTYVPTAEAIRDLEYIQSLDFLPPEEQRRRHDQCNSWFPEIGSSLYGIDAFHTENYRILRTAKAEEPYHDEVRRMLMTILPVRMTWTKEERRRKPGLYDEGRRPMILSPSMERLARFIVAMVGALFILVPMYVMALHQDLTKNLVTTTVAVVLFAGVCSITLGTTNDQTLAVTAGYTAVLIVFVGLTPQRKVQS